MLIVVLATRLQTSAHHALNGCDRRRRLQNRSRSRPAQPICCCRARGRTRSEATRLKTMGDTAHVLEHPSGDGIKVTILPSGATITSVRVPDKHGNRGECVLGFDREEPYLGKNPFFGSVAGRVANRTANAEFHLDGKSYELHANNGHHHLHGGKEGFNRKWWAVVESTATQLTLALRSPDGDEGYPGTLDVRVTYPYRRKTL